MSTLRHDLVDLLQAYLVQQDWTFCLVEKVQVGLGMSAHTAQRAFQRQQEILLRHDPTTPYSIVLLTLVRALLVTDSRQAFLARIQDDPPVGELCLKEWQVGCSIKREIHEVAELEKVS